MISQIDYIFLIEYNLLQMIYYIEYNVFNVIELS